MFHKSVLVAFALIAAGCASKTAPAAPIPTPLVTVAMAGELNAMPSLAASGDRVVLVWTGTKDGVMSLYSAVSDDRGASFNMRRRVNDQPGDVSANVEQPPRVAMSGAEITVVWSSKKTGTSAIRMSRSTDGGRTFSPAMTIHNSKVTGARGWESIAAAPDGSVRVVWLDGRNNPVAAMPAHMDPAKSDHARMDHTRMDHTGSPRQDVYAAIIRTNGQISEAHVASNVCFCCKTAVTVASDGRVVAAWRHIFPGSIRDIAMATSVDGGSTFGPLARVSEDQWEIAGCPEDGPALAMDAANLVHVVWPTVVSGAQTQKVVFYASTKDGRTFTPRVRLSSTDQEEAAHPQMAVRRDGVVGVVWDEPHNGARRVVMRTAAGGQFGPASILNPAGSGDHPVIVPVADGFLVAWTSGESVGSAIEVQRIGVRAPPAKPVETRDYSFRGKVEAVDARAGTLTVNGEDVEGWMGPMTMSYEVGNKSVLSGVKAGDQITATVRTGDFGHLYDVAIKRD
jgi:Cu/Ag efflux protein CusF